MPIFCIWPLTHPMTIPVGAFKYSDNVSNVHFGPIGSGVSRACIAASLINGVRIRTNEDSRFLRIGSHICGHIGANRSKPIRPSRPKSGRMRSIWNPTVFSRSDLSANVWAESSKSGRIVRPIWTRCSFRFGHPLSFLELSLPKTSPRPVYHYSHLPFANYC